MALETRSQERQLIPDEPLLRTVGLTRHFRLGGTLAKQQLLHAVDDFDLTINESAWAD